MSAASGLRASRAVIVGRGAVTALGYDAPTTAASVRANLSRFKESRWVDKIGDPMLLSMAQFLDDDAIGIDRLLALATPAAIEATTPLSNRFADALPRRFPLLCGVSAPRPVSGPQPNVGGPLLARLATRLTFIDVDRSRLLPFGHASALAAMAVASEWIARGTEEIVLVGGVDSYCDADTLEWLDITGRLHSDTNQDGFVPGEGAGFCLVMSESLADRLGLEALASVLSTATTKEPCPWTSEGVCIGQGLTDALHRALAVPEGEAKPADWTICDLNGESFRSREWVYAYLRTGRKHRDPLEIWHPADCYGDVGAASGALLAGIAIQAWQRGYARGKQALVWTSSDDEHRAAALLKSASSR
jgi:3-oxoacyl-[acyl-carrier-protein] synthase-1